MLFLDHKDKIFTAWSLIWLSWTFLFIFVSMYNIIWLSLIIGIPGFLVLWYKFCNTLEIHNN